MNESKFRAMAAMGPTVAGVALVASDDFSARYDLDLARGVFSRPGHSLFGRSYVDRILVLNAAKGGVATSWMLRDMVMRGRAPLALLLNFANPIMAQAAAFAEVSFMSGFPVDITSAIASGDHIELSPATRELTIVSRGADEGPDFSSMEAALIESRN